MALRPATPGAPASRAAAAEYTSSRAASVRVAISASRCATACWSLSGPPNAVLDAAYSQAASSAACAMPTANAPTLGRNRFSVRIATAKPRSGSPSRSPRSTGTPSKASVPIGCGLTMSRCVPDSPGRSAGTRKALTPRAPAPSVVRANTV